MSSPTVDIATHPDQEGGNTALSDVVCGKDDSSRKSNYGLASLEKPTESSVSVKTLELI